MEIEEVCKEILKLKDDALDDYMIDKEFYGEFTYKAEEAEHRYKILEQVYDLLRELTGDICHID